MNSPQPETNEEKKQIVPKKKSEPREYIEAFFTALLIALFLRSFVVEAFKIPSKSMVPNLLVGDHLFVNKFIYGIRWPLSKRWLFQYKTPQRGDVIVFSYPHDESLDYIKRAVGLPGDTIRTEKNDLYVNGKKMNLYPVHVNGVDSQNNQKLKIAQIDGPVEAKQFADLPYMVEWKDHNYFVEDLDGVKHFTAFAKVGSLPGGEWVVPPGHIFAMGDNRDHSADSREWGFVPMENLRGRALFVWFSWDSETIPSHCLLPEYQSNSSDKSLSVLLQNYYKGIACFALDATQFSERVRWNRFGKAIE